MHPLLVLLVFGVIALAELPDKSLFASLVLGARYRPAWVFTGVAAAFAVHVAIAVAAGGALSLLPHRVLQAIVAGLFAVGALLLWRTGTEQAVAAGEQEGAAVARTVSAPSFPRVALTCFAVVFAGEWGDVTQLATANYAARYHDPVSVGIGALAALWLVAGLAVTAGQRLLRRLPVRLFARLAAAAMLAFALAAAVDAAR